MLIEEKEEREEIVEMEVEVEEEKIHSMIHIIIGKVKNIKIL